MSHSLYSTSKCMLAVCQKQNLNTNLDSADLTNLSLEILEYFFINW